MAHDWFNTPLGMHLLECEQSYFDEEVANVFGFNAFQIGQTQHDFLRMSRMQLRCSVGPDGSARVRSDFEQLPIQSSCADMVILPHVLEFSDNPHQVLREVARALMPEGHVIVSAFNPWSMWGLRRLVGKQRHEFPWNGQFISLARLKDWMALLGIEIAAGHMRAYVPPFTTEKWIRRFDFMEAAGDRWWPFAGGVYFLHGIKRVHGIRVITPQWKTGAAKSKRLVVLPQRVKEGERMVARQREPVDQP